MVVAIIKKNCTIYSFKTCKNLRIFNVFRPAEIQVDLHSIHHGNLLDPGTFYSHFTRGIPKGINGTNWEEHKKVFVNLSFPEARTPMYVDFEHDRNVFTVRFVVFGGLFLFLFFVEIKLKVSEIDMVNKDDNETEEDEVPTFSSPILSR